jgi:hypothetical protein
LESRYSVLAHAVVMVGRCVVVESSLTVRKTIALREDAAPDGGCGVAVGSGDAVALRVIAA